MSWRTWLGLQEPSSPDTVERFSPTDMWWMNFNGNQYPILNTTWNANKQEEPGSDMAGYADYLYKSNGVVFACMLVRLMLFSEARFQYRQIRSGRPGDLFGTEALAPLETPWKNGTTGSLLTRMIQDADLGGNSFNVRRGPNVKRMPPDWVDIVLGSDSDEEVLAGDVDAEIVGYLFYPGGRGSGRDTEAYLADEVAHWAPIPDPTASFRGMSWLTPIVREVMADSSARDHKLDFFDNAATPNMIVKFSENVNATDFELFKDKFRAAHEGAQNAYKTLFLGGGADATVVGANFEQMEFKQVQGAGETRIAAAAGVPPVIVGLSEGLQAATYSNYGQARRRFADGTMRPLWRSAAAALATIIDVPGGSELWYDDRDIPFLQEDVQDAANVMQTNAGAMRQLIDAGYEPDSVTDAIVSGDFKRLEHSGLPSVQLQEAAAKANGNPPNGQVPEEDEAEALRALAASVDEIARREAPHE